MSQLRPQGHDLENRVDYLENRVEQIGRKVYGDPPNRVMPLRRGWKQWLVTHCTGAWGKRGYC